jgi:exonuclease SbcD
MRILHTADWHLGKVLKGRERTPEIQQALQELLQLVRSERIELVLVAGDLFDRSVVSSEAEAAAFEFFVGLRESGVPALVIAGNHDSRERLEALAPLLSLTGATVFGNLRFAEQGGVVEARGARVALLPFLSERRLVKASDLLQGDSAEWKKTYGLGMSLILRNLAQGFGGSLNLLVAHLTVEGASSGAASCFPHHQQLRHSQKRLSLEPELRGPGPPAPPAAGLRGPGGLVCGLPYPARLWRGGA